MVTPSLWCIILDFITYDTYMMIKIYAGHPRKFFQDGSHKNEEVQFFFIRSFLHVYYFARVICQIGHLFTIIILSITIISLYFHS